MSAAYLSFSDTYLLLALKGRKTIDVKVQKTFSSLGKCKRISLALITGYQSLGYWTKFKTPLLILDFMRPVFFSQQYKELLPHWVCNQGGDILHCFLRSELGFFLRCQLNLIPKPGIFQVVLLGAPHFPQVTRLKPNVQLPAQNPTLLLPSAAYVKVILISEIFT